MAKTIPLTQGKVAIVDDEDYAELAKHKWHCNSYGYAIRMPRIGVKRKVIWMHRVIAGTPDGMDTDHINGDRLDNRRSNLRSCTTTQNLMNVRKRDGCTSRHKGVYFYKRTGQWMARIYVDGKCKFLGYFDDENEAADAYNREAMLSHGEFAKLNTIDKR